MACSREEHHNAADHLGSVAHPVGPVKATLKQIAAYIKNIQKADKKRGETTTINVIVNDEPEKDEATEEKKNGGTQ